MSDVMCLLRVQHFVSSQDLSLLKPRVRHENLVADEITRHFNDCRSKELIDDSSKRFQAPEEPPLFSTWDRSRSHHLLQTESYSIPLYLL